MQFNNYTTTELITQANDSRGLSQMDRGDMLNLVKELSDRLESMYHDTMVVVRVKDLQDFHDNE